jgi:thiol-disulfide isomerase/thioredoxin
MGAGVIRPLRLAALVLLLAACSGPDNGSGPVPGLESRLGGDGIIQESPAVPSLADFDWGQTRGQVVFIEFWGTWCGPCIRSMPVIQRHWESHRDNPRFRMLAVNTGSRGDSPEAVGRWRQANGGFTFPVYHDTDQALSRRYEVTGIPRTVILDGNGQVAFSGHPLEIPPGLLERLLGSVPQG